jgi:predicted  nucleic acid-binding Zn-ribbon protein
MQFTSIFVSLLLSTAVVAKSNSTTKAVSDKSLCREMASLNKLVALAANTTKLDEKAKNNATKIAEIQAKASDAATQLSTMTSNATLVSTCAVIDAAEKTQNTCDEMNSLQKLVTLASNETALADKAKNNATKIAALEAKASTAATKLQTMTTNTTLVSACSAIASSKAAAKAEKNSM